MQPSQRPAPSRQSVIAGMLRLDRLEFEFCPALGERGFELSFGGIQRFAGGGLFLPGQIAQLFHERSQLAMRTDPCALGSLQFSEIVGRIEIGKGGLLEGLDFVQQCGHTQY